MSIETSTGLDHISRQAGSRLGPAGHSQDISGAGRRYRVGILLEGASIGVGATIIRCPDLTHLFRHLQVANTHLPQIVVHIPAKSVKNTLTELPKVLIAVEPPHQENQVENDQLKSSIDGIRNAIITVKGRHAGLRHDRAIQRGNGVGSVGTTKQGQNHRFGVGACAATAAG